MTDKGEIMENISVKGLGSYSPEDSIDNEYIGRFVETSDEWIVERTGIKRRRLSRGEDTSDMARKAAEKALEDAGISPEEIGLLIVATVTPDNFVPSTASLLQETLGAKNAICFDLVAACSGFIYGIDLASKYMQGSDIRYALIVGAETLSKIVDWEDRNTCVLFGDGAGAAVLEKGEKKGILASYLGSKADVGKSLYMPARPVSNILAKSEKSEQFLQMNGREVFKFAVGILPKCIRKVLEAGGMSIEDIDYIVPHQANYRIISSVADKIGLPPEKFFMNLEQVGNTSAASIGLALDEMKQKGLLKRGMKIILAGFGGGLTWGALLIEW